MILASASPITLTLATASALAYLAAALAASKLGRSTTKGVFLLAWLLHGVVLAIGLGIGLFGGSPHFGFGPALSVTAWLVAVVYMIESYVYPQMQPHWALCALGALAVLPAVFFPGSALHPSTSAWLPLHWVLGIASYGLFGAAVAHAWFLQRTEDRIRLAADTHSGLPLLTIERLTFRFVTAGFVMLSASLLIVLVFGATLYGAQASWKWDHKSVFSVLSWLTFAVLLVGRLLLGWRGRRAVRMLYIGSGLLLLGYVGSRFVTEVILGRTL